MPHDVAVIVLLFAALREHAGCSECTIAVPRSTRVADIWRHLPEQIRRADAPDGVRYAIDDRWTDPAHVLTGGERIALLMPFSGG
jgi:molybdopterin converting factor small subunit